MRVRFIKYEGLGNDFIIVNNMDGMAALEPPQIAFLCNRHFGVGADGLIFIRPPQEKDADFFMEYYNSDGTAAEMCGNGIRCFSRFLWDEKLSDKSRLKIETRAGLKVVDMLVDGEKVTGASVDMGEPVLVPSVIPANYEGENVINKPIVIDGAQINATFVSMGNPHCVIFVDDLKTAPVQTLGPKIETSQYFPQKTNVEFVEVLGRNQISIRVWERGCGETLACGTGACAALVASSLNNKTDRSAVVNLLGGRLVIRWEDDNHVTMAGAANRVFTGSIELQ
ncbi:MAG TPA: diaminopimelate epimerase [Candidatus Aquicultor sp.]|jgi:diaminopimelate epimerase